MVEGSCWWGGYLGSETGEMIRIIGREWTSSFLIKYFRGDNYLVLKLKLVKVELLMSYIVISAPI